MHAKAHFIINPINLWPPKNMQPPTKLRFRPNITTTQFSTVWSRATQPRPRTIQVDDETVAFWDYQFLFVSQRLEVAQPIKLKLVEGALPKDFPCGTYYLTGPGLFMDDYGSRISPLDGHGYVRAFEIDGLSGEVKFSAKYVKTEAQLEECDPVNGSWKFTHRGPFSLLKGVQMFANTKVMKNVANTSILKWGERLFCLWEGGFPYEIHPQTLDTIGASNFISYDDNENESGMVFHDKASIEQCHLWDVLAHTIKPILQGVFKMPPKRLLAHYKIDVKRQRLLVMTFNTEDMVLPTSHCIFYEFGPDFKLVQRREFNIPTHSMIHDWAFTDTHYIIFTNHVKLDVLGSVGAILGIKPMISSLSVDHTKPTSLIYIFPRFSQHGYWRRPIEGPQLWFLHVANAYEQRDNDGSLWIHVHATACGYHWFNFHAMFGYNWHKDILEPSSMNCSKGKDQLFSHLIKVNIRIEQENDQPSLCLTTHLNKWTSSSDFPVINPKHSGYNHRYVYAACSTGTHHTLPHFPFNRIVKLDILKETSHTWSPGSRRFVGEPMFVPGESLVEDNGYLLVVEYVVSQRRCNLLVLDAKRFGERGVLCARFEVPIVHTFPFGFHGIWSPKN